MEGVARILLNTLIWQEENLPAKPHGVSKECHMGWSFITPKHACKVKTGLYFVEVKYGIMFSYLQNGKSYHDDCFSLKVLTFFPKQLP